MSGAEHRCFDSRSDNGRAEGEALPSSPGLGLRRPTGRLRSPPALTGISVNPTGTKKKVILMAPFQKTRWDTEEIKFLTSKIYCGCGSCSEGLRFPAGALRKEGRGTLFPPWTANPSPRHELSPRTLHWTPSTDVMPPGRAQNLGSSHGNRAEENPETPLASPAWQRRQRGAGGV